MKLTRVYEDGWSELYINGELDAAGIDSVIDVREQAVLAGNSGIPFRFITNEDYAFMMGLLD
jgi:hypothetical protein